MKRIQFGSSEEHKTHKHGTNIFQFNSVRTSDQAVWMQRKWSVPRGSSKIPKKIESHLTICVGSASHRKCAVKAIAIILVRQPMSPFITMWQRMLAASSKVNARPISISTMEKTFSMSTMEKQLITRVYHFFLCRHARCLATTAPHSYSMLQTPSWLNHCDRVDVDELNNYHQRWARASLHPFNCVWLTYANHSMCVTQKTLYLHTRYQRSATFSNWRHSFTSMEAGFWLKSLLQSTQALD